MTQPAARSVAHDARVQTPAEQIIELGEQLEIEVRTEETVLRYRRVNRGRRDAIVPDFVIHRTRQPGLIAQAVAASVPGGSPGWDADGALSPMASGAAFESCEPVTEAFHLPEEYRAAAGELLEEVREAGHRSLVEAALADPELGARIVARLRAVVARARVVLGYDAPIVPLRDVYCPLCGGELRVRADASSSVWCAGMVPLAGPELEGGDFPIGWAACGARWPRGSWVRLLEDATS